ncbi:MAG TPA: hypothetical protein VNE63_05395 [Candidatus Acidoferrales bacterium]|nr:hypothetical protein [Candidatus Acidoferrales bacterium]
MATPATAVRPDLPAPVPEKAPHSFQDALLSFEPTEAGAKTDPIEVFSAASRETLQAIMLSRMNTVANLKKDISALISEMVEQLADAKLAEMLLNRKAVRKENGGSK